MSINVRMSTGLLNPYIRIEPEFTYPQKYYLIHDLVGNVIHTTSSSNIYSNINPFPESNVGQIGIIRCEPPANTLYSMVFKQPKQLLTNNTFSIQFYIHPSSNSVQIDTASTSFKIQPNTSNILFKYNGTAVTLPEIKVQNMKSSWNHYMFSMNRSNLFIFVNGTKVYNNSALSQPFNGSFDFSNITVPTSNTVLLSDIKISNEYINSDFTPDKAPFTITSNTLALITGEFNPVYHTKLFSNILTVNSQIPDFNNFKQAVNGSAWWYGWMKANTQSNVNYLDVSVPTSSSLILSIGNTDGSRQSQTFTTTATKTITFVSKSNSYVPFYGYANNISGGFMTCKLNGKELLWSDISQIQLTSRFKLYSGGLVLEEGNPPAFGRTYANDIILTQVNVGVSNIVTASNIGLSNGYGGYLGYNGSTFLMSPVSSLTSNDMNVSYTWNFTQDGKLSNSRSFVTNIYIENI